MVKKMVENFKQFSLKSKRVWLALKKPTKEEFWMVAKISAIGIAILGLIGFIISLIVRVFE